MKILRQVLSVGLIALVMLANVGPVSAAAMPVAEIAAGAPSFNLSAATITSVTYKNPNSNGAMQIQLTVKGTLPNSCSKATLSKGTVTNISPLQYKIAYSVTTTSTGIGCVAKTSPFVLTNTSNYLQSGFYTIYVNGASSGKMTFLPRDPIWTGYVSSDSSISGTPLIAPVIYLGKIVKQVPLGCVYADPHYAEHRGDDFPVGIGTPAYAIMSGIVTYAGTYNVYGNVVIVENNGYRVRYAHLSFFNVKFGDIVHRGAEVGLTGSTGNTTGPHLHLDIAKKAGSDLLAVNPMDFLNVKQYMKVACGTAD